MNSYYKIFGIFGRPLKLGGDLTVFQVKHFVIFGFVCLLYFAETSSPTFEKRHSDDRNAWYRKLLILNYI